MAKVKFITKAGTNYKASGNHNHYCFVVYQKHLIKKPNNSLFWFYRYITERNIQINPNSHFIVLIQSPLRPTALSSQKLE